MGDHLERTPSHSLWRLALVANLGSYPLSHLLDEIMFLVNHEASDITGCVMGYTRIGTLLPPTYFCFIVKT